MSNSKNEHTKDNLQKMEKILKNYQIKKRKKMLQVEAVAAGLETAIELSENKTLIRKFKVDIYLLDKDIHELDCKIHWAEHLISSIQKSLAEKEKQDKEDRIRNKYIKSGELRHYPFKGLKNFSLGA